MSFFELIALALLALVLLYAAARLVFGAFFAAKAAYLRRFFKDANPGEENSRSERST